MGVLVKEKLNHHLAACACSPEGQMYPGLHQKQRGQQVEGGDSAPLLCSGETPPVVLRPALEPSAQGGHGPVAAGPEDATKMIRGWSTSPMSKGGESWGCSA